MEVLLQRSERLHLLHHRCPSPYLASGDYFEPSYSHVTGKGKIF